MYYRYGTTGYVYKKYIKTKIYCIFEDDTVKRKIFMEHH